MSTVKIVICGIGGRMGKRILCLANENKKTEVVGGLEIKGHPLVGKTLDGVPVTDNLSEIIDKADVLIDFSTPEASLANVKIAQDKKCAIVIGTTGLTQEQIEEIDSLAKDIPYVVSPNMSIGVNLVFEFARFMSEKMPKDYNIEIIERHHNRKKDAPSGTAKRLAQEICNATNLDISKDIVNGRSGNVGQRPEKQIGIHAIRAGNIIGDHTVIWAGQNDVIELSHKAQSRDIFASGAVTAAIFVAGSKPGKYSMEDIIKSKPR